MVFLLVGERLCLQAAVLGPEHWEMSVNRTEILCFSCTIQKTKVRPENANMDPGYFLEVFSHQPPALTLLGKGR